MRRLVFALWIALAACSSETEDKESTGTTTPGESEDLGLVSVQPSLLVPGTRVVIRGKAFVPPNIGPSRLVLRGSPAAAPMELVLAAAYDSDTELEASWRGALESGLSVNEGVFQGTAVVATDQDDGGGEGIGSEGAATVGEFCSHGPGASDDVARCDQAFQHHLPAC